MGPRQFKVVGGGALGQTGWADATAAHVRQQDRLRRRKGRNTNMLDLKKLQKMSKDLQTGMESMKEELAEKTVEGAAGGGAVKVVVNGNQELVRVTITPEAVDPDDIEMLQDLVLAAANQAIEKSKQLQQESMGRLTGGKLPNLPFF
jgi:DNA-binding YbaB/EbfC family protein